MGNNTLGIVVCDASSITATPKETLLRTSNVEDELVVRTISLSDMISDSISCFNRLFLAYN